MEVWKTEDPRKNFEKRFAHYEIYTWTLCNSYLHEKQVEFNAYLFADRSIGFGKIDSPIIHDLAPFLLGC